MTGSLLPPASYEFEWFFNSCPPEPKVMGVPYGARPVCLRLINDANTSE